MRSTALKACLLIGALFITSACASTPPMPDRDVDDPWEVTNRRVYNVNEQLDRYIARPVADAYVFVTPRFARRGVTNFFSNARYPGTMLNSALQGKWRQTGRDTVRFTLNSTLGLLGLFDVATPLGFERNNEDFGQTLAVWGTPEGSYIVLPVMGPSTTRDIHDYPVSAATNVVTYLGGWAVAGPLYALDLINTRANLDQAARFRSEAALDEYVFTRSAYRQYRNNLIFDGEVPERDPFDDLDDDFDW
ncbi:MAG: VacJ family lipoprotein [Ectothiorhodospiraceae bacterium]|nr:VacJ family lipoprotein [Ectothiorhodospiraceae bacterium]MCH8502990.1 VacJ family lipoprotein [Ectothiorhodospiraceae bacterium]